MVWTGEGCQQSSEKLKDSGTKMADRISLESAALLGILLCLERV